MLLDPHGKPTSKPPPAGLGAAPSSNQLPQGGARAQDIGARVRRPACVHGKAPTGIWRRPVVWTPSWAGHVSWQAPPYVVRTKVAGAGDLLPRYFVCGPPLPESARAILFGAHAFPLRHLDVASAAPILGCQLVAACSALLRPSGAQMSFSFLIHHIRGAPGMNRLSLRSYPTVCRRRGRTLPVVLVPGIPGLGSEFAQSRDEDEQEDEHDDANAKPDHPGLPTARSSASGSGT
jgi:hypothetical protein